MSSSMEPTIMTGDMTITNGMAYLRREPERGDIITFKNEETEGEYYTKRIIGMPGENISFMNGQVYINGIVCKEAYIDPDIETNCDKEFSVPIGEYFVLGDNREVSADSRYWNDPYVAIDEIKGRTIANFDLTPLKEFFHLQ